MYLPSDNSTVTTPVLFPARKERVAIFPRTIDFPTFGLPWKTTSAFAFHPPPNALSKNGKYSFYLTNMILYLHSNKERKKVIKNKMNL